jgi:hypothetical protein
MTSADLVFLAGTISAVAFTFVLALALVSL